MSHMLFGALLSHACRVSTLIIILRVQYYPPNINHSRCCDQAICTECFVQIKRADPTTTHIVSEPAACPYCVQDQFGVVYTPPLWRAGIGSDGAVSPPLTLGICSYPKTILKVIAAMARVYQRLSAGNGRGSTYTQTATEELWTR